VHSVASRLRVCNSVILVQRKIIVPKLLDNSSQRDYVANFIYNRNICFSWYYNREGNTDHVLQQISALENTDTSEKIFWRGPLICRRKQVKLVFSCPSSRYTNYINLCISTTQIVGCYRVYWPILSEQVFIHSRGRTIKLFVYFC